MIKIRNPFHQRKNYNCFGCSPFNSEGLQLEFYEDGEELISNWQPQLKFAGYENILHGGIQSTLLDEIASWFVFVKIGTAGVTQKIELNFLRPVICGNKKIKLTASLNKMDENVADIKVKLFDQNEKLCCDGNIFYFTFTKEKAERKLAYPGKDAFYFDD